jgi:geranylgeranyl diphosphate synthase, type II
MTTAIDLRRYLEQKRALVNDLIDMHLPPADTDPTVLHQAMRYSALAGGKRLRPILALAAWEYCGGEDDDRSQPIRYAMTALELVHTYSLIHDDLPCMDDDNLRRGQPTCHKQFDEATAVLAGDALHDIAFELIARTGSTLAVVELAQAIGTMGMLGGQMADIQAEGQPVTREDVINIHRRKTGALIRCSVRLGAILAGADKPTLLKLSTYGEKTGLAFQIIDDILDIEGDQATLGKTTGADSARQKATYPAAVGLEQARHDADSLINEAVSVFAHDDDNLLRSIALYIGQRRR